jgi:very-short-patch-repair endonuclease
MKPSAQSEQAHYALPPLAAGRDRVGDMAMSDRERRDPRTVRARALRNAATPQERRIWSALRLLDIPGHFRRQVPIGPYFADFAHLGLKLVIEIDGGQHGFDDGRARDEVRTSYLSTLGYRVLRFWNHEVSNNLEGVIETILATSSVRSPPTLDPSPPQAGGGKTPSATVAIDEEN